MRVAIILPKWGMTMQEGTVAQWTTQVGAFVSEGDAIGIIETEKVEAELIAPASGTIIEIVVEEGATVAVGSTLAWLEQ